jgi:hypothetical protein
LVHSESGAQGHASTTKKTPRPRNIEPFPPKGISEFDENFVFGQDVGEGKAEVNQFFDSRHLFISVLLKTLEERRLFGKTGLLMHGG